MKTNLEIQNEVMEQLKLDVRIAAEKIGVSVNEGVVTLSGLVPSYAEKIAAEKLVSRLPGVKSVVEQMKVEIQGPHVRNDIDIAKAVAHSLEWDIFVPSSVKSTVEGGIVRLSGEVDWGYEKESASASVRYLAGVQDVINFITVKNKVEANCSEVKAKIEAALVRSAQKEAQDISIEIINDRVVLNGHARSHAEMNDIKYAAWAVPGINRVENNLRVY